jgi:hypothetical protein
MTDNSVDARARRIETRLGNLMRWMGYDPRREVARELRSLVVLDPSNALHATTPNVTVGDIVQAVYFYKLDGDVPIYMNGIELGVFNVTKNLTQTS